MTRRLSKYLGILILSVLCVALAWRVLTSWTVELMIRDLRIRMAGTLVQTVSYGPDPAQTLEVWRPRRQRAGRPAVLVLHGGGWTLGSRTETRFQAVRRMLEQGIVVINADYRLHDLQHAVDDADTAWRWVVASAASLNIDPAKTAMAGESAGGHLALYTAFRTNRPPAAVISMYSSSDLMHRIWQPRILTLLPMNQDPEQAAWRLSPLAWVRPGLPPVLSAHGEYDSVVPVDNARRLTAKLREAGVFTDAVYLSRSWHSPVPEDVEVMWAKVFDFLRSKPVSMLQ